MRKNTFKKRERLNSRKTIEKLFAEGNTFTVHPYRVFWLTNDNQDTYLKFAISIPKKKFKKAVDRNLLKRRTREAYRTQKHDLLETLHMHNKKISFFLVYLDNAIVPYSIIEEQINKILEKLKNSVI